MLLLAAMGLELAGAEIIFLVFAILYCALMHSSERQATIGKSLCGLKVAGPDGERISVARALGREAAKIISSLTMLIGFLIAAFTRNKQALHDFVATTHVVREAPGPCSRRVALAVLALFAPAIAVAMFGAGAITSVLGPMAAGILDEPVAMQKPAAQAPTPAAPAAPKPMAEAPKPMAEAPKPAASPAIPTAAAPKPAAEAPKAAAEAPKPAPTAVAAAPAASGNRRSRRSQRLLQSRSRSKRRPRSPSR